MTEQDYIVHLETEISELESTIRYLRKKIAEEDDYRQWLMEKKCKGNLAGYIVLSATQLAEHNYTEKRERLKRKLQKIANNPILSDEVRNAVYEAIRSVDAEMVWRRAYVDAVTKGEKKNGR